MTVAAEVAERFADAGVTGWLHAREIDGTREVSVGADTPVVLASVFKLPLLVAVFRAAETGEVDLAGRVTLDPGARSSGPTGIGAMFDQVSMSVRDLALLAMSVSDNAAGDALVDLVGFEAINRVTESLGLTTTCVVQRSRELTESMVRDAGVADAGELAPLLTDRRVLRTLSALRPESTNRSTPREMTALLAALWRDEAASPESCAAMRRLLGLQVWPHRLASGFPFDDVRVAGKTGTLPTLRNEVGVVEYPDGGRYAVAVFTASVRTSLTLPAADAVIGTAARVAVDHLRAG
ncbi:serine hydrolase [Allokutzneria albata]|uniref:Beta-lactamase class A n=1 Tax=Allokutzneria albata TaxID=211114 RepID=A0A1G9T7F0_ALLAB|nr:serine hydrolase [Allokutzneria albata]SDM43604.1 beta-lactamase class A [Allokutzneria albata]